MCDTEGGGDRGVSCILGGGVRQRVKETSGVPCLQRSERRQRVREKEGCHDY